MMRYDINFSASGDAMLHYATIDQAPPLSVSAPKTALTDYRTEISFLVRMLIWATRNNIA